MPSHCPILQGGHPIGNTRIDQGLGADDASRSSGTINNYQCLGVAYKIWESVDQFRAWTTDRSGNSHFAKFVQWSTIEHYNILISFDFFFQRLRRQMRCTIFVLDKLPKRLARNIDT